MQMVPRNGRALAVAVGAIFVMGGCSFGSSSPSTSSGQAGNTLIQNIKNSGQLRIGVAPDKPNLYQNASGQWVGVYIDLANDWAKVLGVKLVTVTTTFGTMIAGLQANKFDLAMDLNQQPTRALSVNFTDGLLFTAGGYVFNPANLQFTNASQITDNSNYSICTPQGDASDIALTAINPKAQHIRLAGSDTDCFAALISGRVNATLQVASSSALFCHDHPGYKIIFPPQALELEPQAIGLSKNYGFADIQALNIEISTFIAAGGVTKANVANGVVSPLPYTILPVPSYMSTILGG